MLGKLKLHASHIASLALVLSATIVAGCHRKGANLLGPLPDKPLLRYEEWDLRAEVGFQFLIDPALIATPIPAGISPYRAGDVATRDPNLAKHLAGHPAEQGYLLATLSFPSMNTFLVNGRASSPKPFSYAFLWVTAKDKPAIDARARTGFAGTSIELEAWYPDGDFLRRNRSLGAKAELAELNVSRNGSTWSVQLHNRDLEIEGTCELTGSRDPANYTLPQYSTVWGGGAQPGLFTLFTFAGHFYQWGKPQLAVRGDTPLAKAIRAGTSGAFPLRAGVADGWFARAGVYRH